MIRPATPSETSALVALAVSTGLFSPREADVLLRGVLDDLHAGALPPGHRAEVVTDAAGAPLGWTYAGPHEKADGVWELWWIGVAPARHGEGLGILLLEAVERAVIGAGGRLLIIETSALPALEGTRRFYRHRGYTECGLIADYYADGDGKITFAKRLRSPADPADPDRG